MKTEDVKSLFERSAKEKLSDADAVVLMKTVKLSLGYFPAVQEAIRQGAWRNKENPAGYIRTVAMALAVKLGYEDPAERLHLMVPRFDDGGKPLSHDGYLDFLQAESEGPYKSGGVWHAGDPDYDDDEKVGPSDDKLKHLFNLEEGDRVSPRQKLLAKLPPEFLERQEELEGLVGSPDPIYFPDWEKIGRAAGLDPEECYVLELRAMGLSRDRAITSEAPKRRKRIQAAWRRFDRNRCMDQVTALLTNIHKA